MVAPGTERGAASTSCSQMTNIGIYGGAAIYDNVIKALCLVLAGPAEGRVPAIPLTVAQVRQDNRDHRNSPLRGGPVMTPRGFLRRSSMVTSAAEIGRTSTRCP
jgi:hypothetical protein